MRNRPLLFIPFFAQLLFTFAWSSAHGQNRRTVVGIVYNGGTGEAAPGVDIKTQGRTQSADARGFFEIMPSKAAPLEISDVRFHDRLIPYMDYKGGDTLRIYLTPNTTQSSNILVSDEMQRVYEPEFEHALDYVLYRDTLLVLSYIKSKPSMVEHRTVYLQNTLTLLKYGEKLQRLTLPDMSQGLHVDPVGRIFVIGKDFVKELRANRNGAYLKDIEQDFFDTQIWPLTARGKKSVFFKVYPTILPEVVHYVLLTDLDSIRPMRMIRNESYFNKTDIAYEGLHPKLKTKADNLAMEYQRTGPEFAPLVSNRMNRMAFVLPEDPTYAEGDHVLIYDHMNSWIFEHDLEGNPIDSVRMSYHQFSDEKLRKTLQDASTGHCYALHEKSGVYYLRFINHRTGSAGRPFKLQYPYIKNVRIYNGWVYYVFREIGSQEPYSIAREKIPDEIAY